MCIAGKYLWKQVSKDIIGTKFLIVHWNLTKSWKITKINIVPCFPVCRKAESYILNFIIWHGPIIWPLCFGFCFPVNQKDCTCIVSTYNHLKKLWENKDKQLYQNATHHLEDRACSRNSIHSSGLYPNSFTFHCLIWNCDVYKLSVHYPNLVYFWSLKNSVLINVSRFVMLLEIYFITIFC